MSFNSMDQMNKGKGGYAAAVPKKRKPKSNENTKVVSFTVSKYEQGQRLRTTTVNFTLYKKTGFNLFVLNMIFISL